MKLVTVKAELSSSSARMKRIPLWNKIFVCLVLINFLSGCAAPKVKIEVVEPAKYYKATQLKNIAVYDFSGKEGKAFSRQIEAALVNIRIKGKSFFNVIEREKLKMLKGELNQSHDFYFDESKAAEVGKMIGAQGIYVGKVLNASVSSKTYQEDRRKCKQRDENKKCIAYQNYKVTCYSKNAYFKVTPKLIKVETGEIVYARNISKKKAVKSCNNRLPSHAELLSELKNKVISEFVKDVAPHTGYSTLELIDDTKGLQPDQKKLFEQGINFANEKRMDRACALWKKIRAEGTETAAILYNLGVCVENDGDFNNALKLYKNADSLLTKSNPLINKALTSTREKIKKQRELARQL